MLKERPCSCEQRGGDQREPPERRSYWPGRSNYSGQPVGGQKKKTNAGKWKTTLPFPVQVVDRVEVIDESSKLLSPGFAGGKLTTRYFYHHGYWDGGEREFRGFGRVDQFDTETFERYNEDNLVLEADPLNSDAPLGVSVEHYAPPVLAKNWFHLGPVGAEKGDWKEVDFTNEYWSGDANMLQRDPAMLQMIAGLPRRARRDAFRTLRGTALRSELYAIDGSTLQQKPYTVSETQTGLRLVASPNTNATIKELAVQMHSNHIFFSFGLSSRSTTWERGTDPMTKFSFTGAVDDYGQPLSQVSIAVPRGKDPRTGGQLQGHSGVYDPARGYDATIQFTEYIYKDVVGGQYMVDRAKQARSYEALLTSGMNVFELRDLLLSGNSIQLRLLGLGYTYYDGVAYDGAGYGELGAYGVPVRSETLMVQPEELDAVYGDDPGEHPAPFYNTGTGPDWSAFPTDFVSALQHERCGYVWQAAGGSQDYVAGYYTSAEKSKFDFHEDPLTAKGLPVAMQDVFGHEASIEYDDYQLLPVKVTDPVGMETSSEYDYRVLQPERVTDPNLNISTFAFTPLGLMHKTALLGKGDNSEGDTLADPGVLLEYDLFAFKDSGAPVWVKTTQRVHHINADYLSSLPSEEQDATIVAVEYSDGFGRQLQTRTQAEDLRFGDALLGDSGLPADQGVANAPAVGVMRDENEPLNVVVSGAKLYNNKGKVVEQWEPYFGSGFDLTDPTAQHGQRVRIFFDALGRPKRTVNPDGTEQRVVYGVPNLLNTPDSFKPSPWERYTYDANDLAPITHPGNTLSASHHWTPKSELIDALGHTVRTVEHITTLSPAGSDTPIIREDDVVMRYDYDIKGQLLEVTDPLDRVCFEHKYDTAGNNLWTEHLDSGEKKLVVDAQGKPLYSSDAKGAAVYTAYDNLHRPTNIWAKDASAESVTLRQHMLYGDSAGLTNPQLLNLNGKLVTHYDEAGKATITGYDFKGNPLEKVRQVFADAELTATEKYVVDWDGLAVPLDAKEYVTGLLYDGLNRVRKSVLPERFAMGIGTSDRKELVPTYNRAGGLGAITFDGIEHVKHIAYNAKGQRILLARGNHPSGPEFGMMTRYAYDPATFRLQRIRTEKYQLVGNTYEYQSGTTQQDSAYVYDLGGNILTIKERVTDCGIDGTPLGPDALDRQFNYDPLKRLLQATGREGAQHSNSNFWDETPTPGGTPNSDNTRAYIQTYQYDKVGNILLLAHSAAGNSYNRHYHYASGNNILEQIDNGGSPADVYGSFAYDACGNQVQQNTERFLEWDAADQLRFFKTDAGSGPSKEAHYLYAGGQRIKKFVRTSSDIEVTVYIDGVYEHCYKANTSTALVDPLDQNNYHVMDGRSRIATVRTGNSWGDSTPDISYNLEDHLGTSGTRIEASGTPIDHEEYYPFGDSSLRTFSKKRYRYVGKERDNESGLYYYGARYYMAWVGRFISIDPLADEYPQLTPYNYAGNKPICDLDIDGMQGTGDKPHTDPRVREGGQNIKDSSRTNADVLYEANQLPDNAVHGQTETFHYTTGDQTCVDWVYNQEKDSWSMAVDYRDGRTGVVDDLFSGWQSERNPDNLDMGATEKGSESKIPSIDPKTQPSDTLIEKVIPTRPTPKEAAPNEKPISSEGPVGQNNPPPASTGPSTSNSAGDEQDILWPTLGFGSSVVERIAGDVKDADPKYKSSSPEDSPKAQVKANKFLGFLEQFMGGLGLVVDIKDLWETGTKIWNGIKSTGKLLMGEIANLIWTGIGMLLQLVNPIVDMLFAFGDWIASLSGMKDKAIKWINKNWNPQILSP